MLETGKNSMNFLFRLLFQSFLFQNHHLRKHRSQFYPVLSLRIIAWNSHSRIEERLITKVYFIKSFFQRMNYQKRYLKNIPAR